MMRAVSKHKHRQVPADCNLKWSILIVQVMGQGWELHQWEASICS